MKKVRARFFLTLCLALTLITPSSTFYPLPVQAQQDCASPIRVGNWSGSFLRNITIDTTDGVTTSYLTIHGNVDFTVECDGTITGNWRAPDDPESDDQTEHAEYVVTVITPILAEEATCIYPVDFETDKSRVEPGEGGRPRIVWDGTATTLSRTCTGTEGTLLMIEELLSAKTSGSGPMSFDWQESSDEWLPFFLSGESSWDDPFVNLMIGNLGPTQILSHDFSSWHVGLTAAATPVATPIPTSTPNKQEGNPIVTGITPQFQQIFLEGIGPVNNRYTATIDWNGNTPGSVPFSLDGGPPLAGTLSAGGTNASREIAIHTLSPGQHTLSVIAISTSGKTSPVATFPINIATIPAWAVPFNLTSSAQGNTILYSSSAIQRVPETPDKSVVIVPSFPPNAVPYLDGRWGFEDMQFIAQLAASSSGSTQEAPVGGAGKYFVADRDVAFLALPQPGSFIRTRIDPAQNTLLLVDGRAELIAGAPLFITNKRLLEVFPELQAAFAIEPNGVSLSVASEIIRPLISASLSGQAELGIENDKLAIVGGFAQSNIVLNPVPPVVTSDGIVMLAGGGGGGIRYEFAPSLEPQTCFLAGSLIVTYGSFSFMKVFVPSNSVFILPTCASFEVQGGNLGLASPLQQVESGPARLLERSDAWQPERVVDAPAEVNSNGVISATLIENAGALIAAPSLASGPDGRMALAWVGDTPDHARPQSFQTRIRLYDGKAWGPAVTLSENTMPDYTPAVAFDGKGQAVVAWVQNKNPNLQPDAVLDQALLKGMEIAFAVVDANGAIVKSGTLTDDSALDFGPQLATAPDGTVWLAWQSNPNGRISANADNRGELKAARWSGQEWSSPEQAHTNIDGALRWHMAARDSQTALIIAATHTVDTADLQAIERMGSGWSAPATLVSNVSRGANPRAAYLSDGKPVAGWSGTDGISGVIGDLKAVPSVWLTDTATLEGLTTGGDGSIALALSGVSAEGAPALMVAQYDPHAGEWSRPDTLVGDWKATSAPAFVGGANGDAAVTYAWPVPRTEEVDVPSGDTMDVPGLPELARVQIARMPALLPGVTATPQPAANADATIWLVGGGAVLAVVLLGGVLLFRRRT